MLGRPHNQSQTESQRPLRGDVVWHDLLGRPLSHLKAFSLGGLAASLLLILSACTNGFHPHQQDQSVIGGEPVPHQSQEAAGLARLIARPVDLANSTGVTRVTQCTASFITRHTLVTAAHCIKTGQIHEIYATANEDFGPIKVERVVIHPNYQPANAQPVQGASGALRAGRGSSADYGPNSPRWPDLALLFLEVNPTNEAQVLSRVRPVSVGRPEASFGGSFLIRAFGFGLASLSAEFTDRQLRVAEFRGVMYEPTLSYFRVSITQRLGLCSGDSGGPALMRSDAGVWSLLGVLAHTETTQVANRDVCDLSATYVNLSPYLEWIIAELNR